MSTDCGGSVDPGQRARQRLHAVEVEQPHVAEDQVQRHGVAVAKLRDRDADAAQPAVAVAAEERQAGANHGQHPRQCANLVVERGAALVVEHHQHLVAVRREGLGSGRTDAADGRRRRRSPSAIIMANWNATRHWRSRTPPGVTLDEPDSICAGRNAETITAGYAPATTPKRAVRPTMASRKPGSRTKSSRARRCRAAH